MKADPQIATLLDFRYQQHYRAQRGQHGRGKNQEGRSAPPLVLPVPVGPIVRDAASGETLKDFIHPEEIFMAAQGGAGGRGNAHFATPTRRVPRFAEPGQPGEERWFLLELKLIADVGIVGFPNAGKSTLISKISAARPKIADYPFTTLVPHLGVVTLRNRKPFVIADIPGIIIGAHKGAGLGLQFLRHVERTSLLLHLLDISAAAPRDPIKDYLALNRELALYSPKLAAKPQVIALNKIDLSATGEKLEEARRYFKKIKKEIFPISALTGEGLPRLLNVLARNIDHRGQEETFHDA